MAKAKKESKNKGKATEEDLATENAKWTEADESLFVETLTAWKQEGAWGDNNPKSTAWHACRDALAGSEKVSSGAPKSITVLKSRWQKVSQLITFMYVHSEHSAAQAGIRPYQGAPQFVRSQLG